MTSILSGILNVSYNETVVPLVNVEQFILCKGVNYFALQVGNPHPPPPPAFVPKYESQTDPNEDHSLIY